MGKPNPYRDPFPNIDQIVGDTTVTVGSQAGCSSAQNENTIAVNPENPRNIVSGTNDYRVFNSREQRNDSSGWAYTSFDGGRTWKNVELPHLTFQTGGTGAFAQMDSAGDPVVAFGPHNTVYYGNIVFSRGTPTGDGTEAANGIALNVSHDGGLHWSEPLLIQADGVTRNGTLTASTIFNDKIGSRRTSTAGGSTSPGPGSPTLLTAATSSHPSCSRRAATTAARSGRVGGWTSPLTSSTRAA